MRSVIVGITAGSAPHSGSVAEQECCEMATNVPDPLRIDKLPIEPGVDRAG
jgi:hypothetical protein